LDEIDEKIRPLVEAMNNTGWIKTVSSCEGHPGYEYHDTAYVACFVKGSMLKKLSKILNVVSQDIEENNLLLDVDVTWVYCDEVYGSQEEAPRGYISLDMKFACFDKEFFDEGYYYDELPRLFDLITNLLLTEKEG